MPRTDQHFRYLLAAGLRENISLQRIVFVDPSSAPKDSEVMRRAKEIFQPQIVDRGLVTMHPWRTLALLGDKPAKEGSGVLDANARLAELGRSVPEGLLLRPR